MRKGPARRQVVCNHLCLTISQHTAVRTKAFDFNVFWKGFGNISSLEVTDYVHRYHEEHPKAFETEKSQMVKNYADIAAKLKSIRLTDEAIEYALKTPKTTLRRWAEKQGYEWRKWSMDHPYRFKKIYGEKQDAESARIELKLRGILN